MSDLFARFSRSASEIAGKPATFVLAVILLLTWALTGPLFGFSDTWQLIINTGTTIITFLLVFLIQSSQNRDTTATQIKLNEIICALDKASNRLIDIEHDADSQLEAARQTVNAQKES